MRTAGEAQPSRGPQGAAPSECCEGDAWRGDSRGRGEEAEGMSTARRGDSRGHRQEAGGVKPNCRGFTLLELMVALVLLGLLSAVLFGSVKLAGRSTDSGEAKAESASSMRLAEEFLRANLAAQHPLRMRKIVEFPLLFVGASEELRYASALPPRVAGGGIWFYRLAVRGDETRAPLVLERMVPDLAAEAPPEFVNADRSVLAEDIASLKLGYFGRDRDAAASVAPTWRDRWDDPQQLPLLIRVDVAPKHGPAWPTLYVAPREAPEAGCRAWDAARQHCAGV